MPFGKARTDVRKALEAALASGAWIKMHAVTLDGSEFRMEGYVNDLVEDRVVTGDDKESGHGLSTMLSDIRSVSIWEEPGDSSGPDLSPEPVGGPPPKSMSPGKREKVPD